jgi:hypothetical protein
MGLGICALKGYVLYEFCPERLLRTVATFVMKVFAKICFFPETRGSDFMAQHLYSRAVLSRTQPGHWLS